MPECKTCEGAGTVIKTPEGEIVPFYKAASKSIAGEELPCVKCDGWGRVSEEVNP